MGIDRWFEPLDVSHLGLLVGSSRNLDKIDACLIEPAGHDLAVLEAESTSLEVG
jgi:hypothetical protein